VESGSALPMATHSTNFYGFPKGECVSYRTNIRKESGSIDSAVCAAPRMTTPIAASNLAAAVSATAIVALEEGIARILR